MPVNVNALRRLAIYLSMDLGVIVLFRHNHKTKRYACIWGDTPAPEVMKQRAHAYIGRITGLDLHNVEWINSDRLLNAINRPNSSAAIRQRTSGQTKATTTHMT